MKMQLTVALRVFREQFIMESFIGTDDIFALVKEGSFVAEGENGRVTVCAGEGMLFKRNVLYCRHVITPVTMYLFRYKSETHAFPCEHVTFRDQARLCSTFSTLELLDSGVFENDFEYRRHLFSDLVVQYAIESRNAPSADPVIESAINEIKRSLHLGINLQSLGEQSGLSYVQFLRRFKSFSGMSPSDYIITLRLQKAKSMLADTDLLIKEISLACGFENEYYFSNFFKKHTSLSPSAFRTASRT